VLNCICVDFQLPRQLASRRQGIFRPQDTHRDRALNFVDYLAIDRTRVLMIDLNR
jgi:hypothetical protein